jgi:hypothetical protein
MGRESSQSQERKMNYMNWIVNTLDLYYQKNRVAGPSLNTIYARRKREIYRALATAKLKAAKALRTAA